MTCRVRRSYASDVGPARSTVRERTIGEEWCISARRGIIRPETALKALQALKGIEARKARTLFAGIATAWVALIAADGTASAADVAMAGTVRRAEFTARAEVTTRAESIAVPSAAVVPVVVRQFVQNDAPQWRTPRPDVAIACPVVDDAASLDRAIEPPVAPSNPRGSARVIRGYDAAGPPSPVGV
jgi:hypothetical protein